MFPLPLVIETRASALARAAMLGIHLAAASALFLASLPTPPRLAGLALLGASLWRCRKPAAPLRLRARADGQLEVWRDAAWKSMSIQPDSLVLPGLIVLRWREDGRSHSLVLPADALSGEEHRRLRLWLRWKCVVAVAAAGSSRIRAS